jgi:hypothetical protein
MSNEILAEISNAFGKFIAQAQSENTLYPACWRRTILHLNMIVHDKANLKLFSVNARIGFYHLNSVVFNTACLKCDDKNAFIWLNAFSNAWLNKEKLPEFGGCCSEISYTSDNSDD